MSFAEDIKIQMIGGKACICTAICVNQVQIKIERNENENAENNSQIDEYI